MLSNFSRDELCSFFKHVLSFCSVVGPLLGARYGKMIKYLDFKYLYNYLYKIWTHHPVKWRKTSSYAHNTNK